MSKSKATLDPPFDLITKRYATKGPAGVLSRISMYRLIWS